MDFTNTRFFKIVCYTRIVIGFRPYQKEILVYFSSTTAEK